MFRGATKYLKVSLLTTSSCMDRHSTNALPALLLTSLGAVVEESVPEYELREDSILFCTKHPRCSGQRRLVTGELAHSMAPTYW